MIQKLFLVSLCVVCVFGGSTIINEGTFLLETKVVNGTILNVKIVAETLGYIGFGISPRTDMVGADIIITGYDSTTGDGYLDDMYAAGNRSPVSDFVQNVELIYANENATHTTVEFERELDTGDVADDIVIEDKEQIIIWAIGVSDSTDFHDMNRGSVPVNLMLP